MHTHILGKIMKIGAALKNNTYEEKHCNLLAFLAFKNGA